MERAYDFVGVAVGLMIPEEDSETLRRSDMEGALTTFRVGERWGFVGENRLEEIFAVGKGRVGPSLVSPRTNPVSVGKLLPRGSL